MVKLFKRKSRQQTKDFKFDTSLKLKSLPLEEYAHVAYAFQVASLRFERMLKESLLEGYITSTTLEKITREFRLADVRTLEIPDIPSLRNIFGSEAPIELAKKPLPTAEVTTPSIDVAKTPITQPSAPEVPSTTPLARPQPSPYIKSPPPTISTEPPEDRPTISFSFPDATVEPKEKVPSSPPTLAPRVSPKKEMTPPSIPKISFPSLSKTTSPPSLSPLAQPKGQREEDRATGIAILRKQMLTELKKIRSVVSEQER